MGMKRMSLNSDRFFPCNYWWCLCNEEFLKQLLSPCNPSPCIYCLTTVGPSTNGSAAIASYVKSERRAKAAIWHHPIIIFASRFLFYFEL